MQLGCHARRERLRTHLTRRDILHKAATWSTFRKRSYTRVVRSSPIDSRISDSCVGGLRGVGRLVPRFRIGRGQALEHRSRRQEGFTSLA
ncbi:hypothetical protein MHYP_G00236860 [Metynnis hypsauchen]